MSIRTGYYRTLETLRDQNPNADFNFLKEEYEGTKHNALVFLHEHCDVFAYELAKRFYYKIAEIRDNNNTLIHAYCIAKFNGETTYIDIRGITTDAAVFFSEFDQIQIDHNGCLDEVQFAEGSLSCNKFLTPEKYIAVNKSMTCNWSQTVVDSARTFLETNSDNYDLLYHMELNPLLYGCSARKFRTELHSIDEVARFIVEEGVHSDVQIYKDQTLFISTFGIFLDWVADQGYLTELIKVLVPLQMADPEGGVC